jgi:hypothetical protein
MYRGGRPGRLARAMNALGAWMYSHGVLTFGRGATLRVRGRVSGRPVDLPVVIAEHGGSRYLVSMLGDDANWVRNVRAAGGEATLVRRDPRPIRLVEVPVGERAPILRRYLALAPGARPHIPVSRNAPSADFERIAAQFPVFRIDPREQQPPTRPPSAPSRKRMARSSPDRPE